MCGRFAAHPTLKEDVRAFRVSNPEDLRSDEDVRPTTDISVILTAAEDAAEQREIAAMRWGFVPHWYDGPNGGPLLINARAETIATKPAFREACRQRRCLVPASGFYEWQSVGQRGKRVHWLEPADGGCVTFAGIWQHWQDGSTARSSVAIVTAAAGPDLAHIHHRVPVAISPDDHALWLGEAGHGAATLMRPAPEGWWSVEPDRGPPASRTSPRLL